MALADLLLGGASIVSGLSAGRKAKKAASKAKKQQLRLFNQTQQIYNDLIKKYQPSGEYGQTYFDELNRAGQISKGRTAAQYLRAGIGGTSFADVNAQYERNVGRPERRKLEDILMERRTDLQREKVNALSQYQFVGPSYQDIASAYSGVGTGLQSLLSSPETSNILSKLFQRRRYTPGLDPGGELG